MTHRVRITDEAIHQIEAIGDFVAKDSPLNAKRWLKSLYARIASLGDFPDKHAVIYSANEAGVEVRQTFYGVYRILYSIDGDFVHVLSVRHGARKPIGPEELKEP